MYKIPDQVVQFIKETMQTWRVRLTAERKKLRKGKYVKGKFQGEAQSPLPFVIAMMPFNHMLTKCKPGYKLSKSQEKINTLMHMDIKLFDRSKKREGVELPNQEKTWRKRNLHLLENIGN